MTEVDDRLISDTLEVFRNNPDKKYDPEQINDILRMNGSQAFKKVVKSLAILEGEGKINVNSNGRFKLAPPDQIVTGEFRANEKGFGFVRYDETDPDIFVARPNVLHAINGDEVKVKITKPANPWGSRGPEGEIVEITGHGLTELVGEFQPYSDVQVEKTGLLGYVQSHEKKIAGYRVFIPDEGLHPQMGDMVKVSLTQYPSDEQPNSMQGVAETVLGNKNDPGVDILTIVYDNDIHVDFPDEVINQAEDIPDTVTSEDRKGRVDITDQVMVTIDGDDSKDFDDAVTLWKLDNGNFHLGVSIADVSYYVTEGSPLDQEAYDRGTSTYLTDRVIPMIPFRLSNGICSLNPGVDRLSLTCDMEIDKNGHVVSHEIYPSVINSHARLTYSNVNKIFDNDKEQIEANAELVPMLNDMHELHDILYAMRHDRGAIDFEAPEAKIIVDDNGKAVDIEIRDRGISERMIESFMLAANETVAEHYRKQHLPFLYRVHEKPDEEKVKNFFETASTFGIQVQGSIKNITPKMLQTVVTKTKDTPEELVTTTMLLRSMQQARYSEDALGHFGLAAEYYTHFTSPIRRYPDLVVHRMIHQYSQNTDEALKEKWNKVLPDIGQHSSIRERHSIDAERAVNDLKKTEYMEENVGEVFDGVVGSATSFGIFVTLENTVEGLVHISNMHDDFYEFDERQLALVGKRTHKTYKIGQPIKVKLTRADLDSRKLDFEVVLPPEEQKKVDEARKKNANRQRGGNKRHNDRNKKPFNKR
ncbi:ribonuclease R [Companilactobacillus sp. RD055328]|uniref:ribonuclease R n=1 Tax=Companilactobacillus sp. RD055328 TaxID=2916634 RepID=UPI001FC88971|nr:ribonuclease R [Companilactobacillus sp. RD055328]GKQ43022.1 ribonuclease R [Companilactobacillus sp. RD055328]